MGKYISKCFLYEGPSRVRLDKIEIGCGPTDIVIRVDVCGRCGTDQRLFCEPHPNVQTPTVLGHELVGRVVEVGRDVHTLTQGIGYKQNQTLRQEELCLPIGQRVTVQSRIARMRDGLMLIRNPIQNLSYRIPGGFAQYMKIPADMIRSGSMLPILDQVTDEEAALVEPAACALECIYATPHAVGIDAEGRHIVRSGIRKGGRTLIIGSGTLAMIYGLLARTEGASEVWFMVRSQSKADLLGRLLGDWPRFKIVPDYTSLPLSDKLNTEAGIAKELADLTHSDLFDDVVLAAPSLDGERLMFRLLSPDGYSVAACFAGLHKPTEQTLVDNLHYRMAKAVGTSGCSTRTMETILKWISRGELSLKGLTCPHHYTLNTDPAEFFLTKADGRKPMLYPWE
jgi:L-iditol 2-dehydrogenase